MMTNADIAFERAIAQGRLSTNPQAENYAGHYMFMGYGRPRPGYVIGESLFKHIDTRQYLDSEGKA